VRRPGAARRLILEPRASPVRRASAAAWGGLQHAGWARIRLAHAQEATARRLRPVPAWRHGRPSASRHGATAWGGRLEAASCLGRPPSPPPPPGRVGHGGSRRHTARGMPTRDLPPGDTPSGDTPPRDTPPTCSSLWASDAQSESAALRAAAAVASASSSACRRPARPSQSAAPVCQARPAHAEHAAPATSSAGPSTVQSISSPRKHSISS
jgi:hypothetical protein